MTSHFNDQLAETVVVFEPQFNTKKQVYFDNNSQPQLELT
jgi:hypothetical protein